ncbi:UDP-4-amino-4,6-dideoxy-N-acetyl-beta-L-altrosamine transaminase [Tenacibaculum sp. E3R01]|uniref:UDP-4-amino-4, 6-dideoxy-N-acetyl-beta-L-altrosamine transaminase n=1 Tax=Tenacibaculum sp. E3R01 TaxID=2267227 RepID=UPI000DE88CE6|nr:UDP-4-amino-4,6-dideoxy-N-acetyl-beta-L-altrosamine transaminase [Tenacibaculum sp. E3R01]RBW56384.1 UDP-4-amino-4,6-dideoxy-N-acetyl-beta-L-altrosamine transaminase [Tenacibaculum sp. E3R01]
MTKFNIPYGRHNIEQDDIDSVVKTLQSDLLTQGPKVEEFEHKFAKYVGAKYAVAMCNATAGLHLAVLSLNLKKGDRIITTPITFASSANCARFVDAEVWFADINPETYLIDIDKTRELLKSKPKGFFKGIIPVNFGGLPVNLEDFKKLADEYDLWIIEDSCHSPGGNFTNSKKKDQYCGNGNYADISVFSFHPVKHIACGEGGMITTNSKEIYDRVMLLRTHGITKNNMKENHGNWYYEMQTLGFNYRLTDIHASLGITQLAKNDKRIIKRNQIANKYIKAFNGKVKFQHTPPGYLNAYHLFVVEVKKRKKFFEFLVTEGIVPQIHYIPLHTFPYYKSIGYENADLKNAENYYKNCFSLPMYPSLSDEEQNHVIKKVLEFVNKEY